MNAKRIACQTYHKHPREDWPVEEFHPYEVTFPEGGQTQMQLAERGSLIGSKSKDQLWVREIRKQTQSGRLPGAGCTAIGICRRNGGQ